MPEENQKETKDDSYLDSAIDDINKSDSNKLLDHDNERPSAPEPKTGFKAKLQKIKEVMKDIWEDPKKRKILIASCVAFVFLIGLIPYSRYFVLNTVGVRSSASVRVLDQSTGQPLKNVNVKIANSENKTDNNGVAKLERIKLGGTELTIEKRAFADVSQKVTIGWGSNPLGDFEVKPTGLQYSFKTTDFLSSNPVEKAEISSGEYSAFSDEEGLAVITIEDPGEEAIDIEINADGYRKEMVTQEKENKEVQNISMVASRKHVFISKRTGNYDVYKIDADGQNEELVLSGTGNEKEDMSLIAHPDRDLVALVSTRDSVRNKDGFLLSTLTLIDLSGDEVKTESLATSERIQIVGWDNEHLIYVRIAEGASASNPNRHRLVTYNTDFGQAEQIASSNYFNDVVMIKDKVYYSPSSYQGGETGLYQVDTNGENSNKLFDQEVWSVFRTDYNSLMFSVRNDWYEYKITDGKILAASGAPAVQLSRLYVDGPEDSKKSVWIDQRDGKGSVIEYGTENNEERTVYAQSGLTYPVRWMNDSTILYRISTDQETADYVVSLNGGEPKKITDVTNSGGLDRWYYY